MARKKKSEEHDDSFGVPLADDEGKSSVQKVKEFFHHEPKEKAKKQLPKGDINSHSKFDKFKGKK